MSDISEVIILSGDHNCPSHLKISPILGVAEETSINSDKLS